ncbi:MAG TPA: NADH-quinone oxidoreductase subunit J [Cyclobacteriaceae bacterium]
MTLYAFYFLSFLAVLGALMVVFSRNPVTSVIFLVMTFFTIACHYMLLNAQFLAAVHIIVYAGAIMVLFLYVIMLLNLNDAVEQQKTLLLKVAAVVTGGLLMIVLSAALRTAEVTYVDTSVVGSASSLGKVLLSEYLLPFEAVSLLLLAAMTGAIMLARTRRRKAEDAEGGNAVPESEQTESVAYEQ